MLGCSVPPESFNAGRSWLGAGSRGTAGMEALPEADHWGGGDGGQGQDEEVHLPELSPSEPQSPSSPQHWLQEIKTIVTCQAGEGGSKVCAPASAWDNLWTSATPMGARGCPQVPGGGKARGWSNRF